MDGAPVLAVAPPPSPSLPHEGEGGLSLGGASPGLPSPAPWWQRWVDGVLGWRDRQIASPRFQAWAARFPLTRGVARQRAADLFDLCAGFVYTQTLTACVQVELFQKLQAGPRTPEALAPELGLTVEAARRLLSAAAALGLVEPRGQGRYGLGQLGAATLGAPGVVEMIRHHGMFYRDLTDPVGLLRGAGPTELGAFWGYAGGVRTAELGTGDTAPYSALMAASQAMVAADVLDAYPIRRHRRLMDVGGGFGAFAAAAARAAPDLHVSVFDLPAVAAEAAVRLADLGPRATALGGDFFADPLPRGADVISLVRIVHDHDDGPVRRLLAAVHAALPPGGTLLLAEPMADQPGARRFGDAYFGWYMAAMGAGRTRSQPELCAMLAEAGFTAITPRRTARPLMTGLIVARRSLR